MSCLAILEHPDPRLRLKSAPVLDFDDSLTRLIDDLFDTLYATGGIGLCAPQIAQLQQVLVMDLSGNATEPREYINPQILSSARTGLVEESCLSIPGVVGNVLRATQVRVRAYDRYGQSFERELSDMYAVCLQHEMDHLNGMLFIDRLSAFRRWCMRLSGTVSRRHAVPG